MNLLKLFIIVISITLFAGISLADTPIIANVNGKPLTAFELNEEFQNILPTVGAAYHGGMSEEKIASIREKALGNLVEKELQYQYALEKGLPVSDKEIESEVTGMEKRIGSSAKLRDALKKSGITKGTLREFIKKRLLAAKAKDQEVTSKAALSDAGLKEYYEKNKKTFNKPEEFRASHILIGVDPAASMEDRSKKLQVAKDILAKIKAGEDFVTLAMRHSTDENTAPIGGDIGAFHKGMMADDSLEKAVLSLKVGEISDVVESLYGYHIIRLTGLKPPTQLSFDDVKTGLRMELEKKKAAELYKKWMEGLKATAKIEILKK